MNLQDRYHIQFEARRTTITLDTVLSNLLALKLETVPNTTEAHTAVRKWLEETLREKMGGTVPKGSRVSQWARIYAIEEITETDLKNKYWEWRLEENTDER